MRKWLWAFVAVWVLAAVGPVAEAGEENARTSVPQTDSSTNNEAEEAIPYLTIDDIEGDISQVEERIAEALQVTRKERQKLEQQLAGKPLSELPDDPEGTKYIWESQLFGRTFTLERVNGEPVKAPRPITVAFDKNGMIAGRVCNAFRGKVVFDGMLIRVPAVVSTRMACPDAKLAELEASFVRALELGIGYFQMGNALELRRDTLVMNFVLDGAAPEAAIPDVPASKPAKPAPSVIVPSRPAPPAAPAPAPTPAPTPAPDAGSTPVSDEGMMAALIGKRYVLTHVDGRAFVLDPEIGRQPFIEFGEGFSVAGRACNNFNGKGILRNGIFSVPTAASTMKLCIDDRLMAYESGLHSCLRDGMILEMGSGTITLRGNGREFSYKVE